MSKAREGQRVRLINLKGFELSNLPMLKSIYKRHLRFPCLIKIGVESFHLVLGVALVVMNLSSVTVMINGSVGG